MNIEDIKVGETYNVRVKVINIPTARHVVTHVDTADEENFTIFFAHELGSFSPVTSQQQASACPTPPKYDPCRLFRKGDIVETNEINGRLPQELRGCYRYEVIVGEGEMASPLYVTVKPLLAANYKHLTEIHVNVVFLKLVTPVEELKPYSVVELSNGDYAVYKGDERLCVFRDGELVTPVEEIKPYSVHETDYLYRVMLSVDGGEQVVCEYRKNTHPHAKERAEAERDRLNAEHRKEQNNG